MEVRFTQLTKLSNKRQKVKKADYWKSHFLLTFSRLMTYTECPRRNVPDFGMVFLMLKYTDITQNTYVHSWTVTEIMAREKCGLLAGPRTLPVSCRKSYRCPSFSVVSNYDSSAHASELNCTHCGGVVNGYVSAGIHVSCIVLGTLRTTMTWVRVLF
jgi:hypothetical protein